MAFKGTLPSELWLKYSVEGGRRLMEVETIIGNLAITEKSGKGDAKGMVARRDQRREQRKLLSNNNELLDVLRDSGVPFKEADSGEVKDDK